MNIEQTNKKTDYLIQARLAEGNVYRKNVSC